MKHFTEAVKDVAAKQVRLEDAGGKTIERVTKDVYLGTLHVKYTDGTWSGVSVDHHFGDLDSPYVTDVEDVTTDILYDADMITLAERDAEDYAIAVEREKDRERSLRREYERLKAIFEK